MAGEFLWLVNSLKLNDKPLCENGKLTSISELFRIKCKWTILNGDATIQVMVT